MNDSIYFKDKIPKGYKFSFYKLKNFLVITQTYYNVDITALNNLDSTEPNKLTVKAYYKQPKWLLLHKLEVKTTYKDYEIIISEDYISFTKDDFSSDFLIPFHNNNHLLIHKIREVKKEYYNFLKSFGPNLKNYVFR